MKEEPEHPRGRLLYAASESHADLLYATRFSAPDPFLWYATPAGCGLVVSALEVGRAEKTASPDCVVQSVEQAFRQWGGRRRGGGAVDQVLALARHAGIRHWEVPADFPLGLARELGRRGLRLEPIATFFPQRAVKSKGEVTCIGEGVRLAEAGLLRAVGVLGESRISGDGSLEWEGSALSAERLRGEIDAEIARHGGSASHTITAPGVQGADPHQAGHGPIRAGEPIVIDIFPRVDSTGYFGDLTRTLVKGQASETVRRAYAAVRAAQQQALGMIRAGVTGREVHEKAAGVLEEHGFPSDSAANPPRGFFHGTGHGLGLEIHEMPRLSPKSEDVLVPGHVVTVEPGLYYPEWGGVRLEDVVVVSEQGCRNLTSAPFGLEIA